MQLTIALAHVIKCVFLVIGQLIKFPTGFFVSDSEFISIKNNNIQLCGHIHEFKPL